MEKTVKIKYTGRRANAVMTDRSTGVNYEFARGDDIEVSEVCAENCVSQVGNWILADPRAEKARQAKLAAVEEPDVEDVVDDNDQSETQEVGS